MHRPGPLASLSTSTDFKTLGRLGTASDTLSGGTLRRRLGLRGSRTVRRGNPLGAGLPSIQVAGIAVAVVLVVLFVLGQLAQSQLQTPTPSASSVPSMDPALEANLMAGGTMIAATGSRTLIPGGGATTGTVEVPQAFAAIEDLALHLPSRGAEGVVFTEADAVDMLPLAPVGTMTRNDNPGAYTATREIAGPDYAVGSPSTGVRPATGLARILMVPGAEVIAPVTGEVVAVDEYSTSSGRDWRIVIQPATRDDVQVVVRRVEQPQVVVGQEVGVGQAVLGTVRVGNPTRSEVNPLALPSVWVSVRPATNPDMVDPYAPAVAATVDEG